MLDRLSHAGYKITEPRRRVLGALRKAGAPLTAQEVAAHAGASVASTYRALTLLVQLGLVSELADPMAERDSHVSGADGAGETRGKRYALCASLEHHHHFTCRSCYVTLEVTSDALERALEELEAATGALIERHEVSLRGLCAACRGQIGAEG
ncbi:MAG TPA: Fur family transcriptional regulator [Ktedonobacterales bacterium]|nr:Fur family transcriptional regulator [Ktedonobacterales bacterium]